MKIGPRSARQFHKLATSWEQGQHIVVSGPTGSGKSTIGRHLDEIRIHKGGHVVVFIAKFVADKTITNEYAGWKRWSTWNDRPSPRDNRILLWPDVTKAKTIPEKREIQREAFRDAINKIMDRGHQTVDFDEGLYMCNPMYMNLASEISLMHEQGRSANITVITKMQRPANVPLVVYGSAAHAFLGQSREANDQKRLAELGGSVNSKELIGRLSKQDTHDFTWVPVREPKWPIESMNLRK